MVSFDDFLVVKTLQGKGPLSTGSLMVSAKRVADKNGEGRTVLLTSVAMPRYRNSGMDCFTIEIGRLVRYGGLSNEPSGWLA